MKEASVNNGKKLLWCDQCKVNHCFEGYKNGKPSYCPAVANPDILESIPDKYLKPEVAKFHLAISRLQDRQKTSGIEMSRIQESIEYAKELKVKKVGLAVCNTMLWQATEFAKLMRLAGLEPCTVNCMAGGMTQEETGIPEEWTVAPCNPVLQAEILNKEGTEFNFIYGLCVGHDTLFIQHSKAPVSVVVVKDRVTVNNPGAVLSSFYHRNKLWMEYGGEPDNSRI